MLVFLIFITFLYYKFKIEVYFYFGAVILYLINKFSDTFFHIGSRDLVWSAFAGQVIESASSGVLQDVREIETWILRLLSAPVPVPGRTKVEVH